MLEEWKPELDNKTNFPHSISRQTKTWTTFKKATIPRLNHVTYGLTSWSEEAELEQEEGSKIRSY
jgi:hypothetical protein